MKVEAFLVSDWLSERPTCCVSAAPRSSVSLVTLSREAAAPQASGRSQALARNAASGCLRGDLDPLHLPAAQAAALSVTSGAAVPTLQGLGTAGQGAVTMS